MNTQQPAQTAPSVALQPARAELQNHQDNFPMTKEEIRELISSQVKQTIDEAAPKRKSRGHPYPIEYDSIPFPDGYIVPKFKTFYGLGNPDQHLAHFRASCGNTGGNSALLLRQFPQSLSGVAFEWYYSLEDESITTWDDVEEAFRNKFATVSDKITIADLTQAVGLLMENRPACLTNFQTQKPKREEGKKVEVKTENFKAARTNVAEKGKKVMTTTTERASPKPILGGNTLKHLPLKKERIKFILSKGTK
uniref:Retrotransposon gag domain-containing protein n=1 Tax=Ananas comosus var. bracteatus TaxID=296719 RepID=A0A6V7PS28_ANACO|nr:unnamed protein product [Ananas comosus var. bracteatus]